MGESDAGPVLQKVRQAIVVVDVVESVRLMQAFEADVIERWRHFVAEVRQRLLPPHQGRLVKSLGDGMLLAFATPAQAAAVAGELHRSIARYNDKRGADAAIHLRVGAHVAEVVSDEIDVYGAGVNLAARLCTLASPGETLVSADFRDGLVDGLDPQVEDLGEFQLKHVETTVRAFRLGSQAATVLLPGFDTLWRERPAFAVLPLQTAGDDAEAEIVAEVVADQLTRELSGSQGWRVISRLSMVAFRGRHPGLDELARHLKPTWVVSGRCRVLGPLVRVSLEVADVRSASVVWSDIVEAPKDELLKIEGALGSRIAQSLLRAIFSFELQRSRTQPLPTLASHTLLFAAMALMHRVSPQDFARGRDLLELLCERHPRAPEPHAWLAKWHVLQVVQGWAPDPARAKAEGQSCVARALQERPDHALGLAVDGLIGGLLGQDLSHAERRYEAALAADPSESLAWLFQSATHAYRDRGEQAAQAAMTALRLSPLDPLRYFYDSFAAHAMLAAGRPAEAVGLAERSLRVNAAHLPTHRSLVIARMLAGQPEAARRDAQVLLALKPGFTVAGFLASYPGRETAFAARSAEALAEAGVPRG